MLDHVGVSNNFTYLSSLNKEQKDGLKRALDQLKDKKFIIFGRKIVVFAKNNCSNGLEIGPELFKNKNFDTNSYLSQDGMWYFNKEKKNFYIFVKYYNKRNRKQELSLTLSESVKRNKTYLVEFDIEKHLYKDFVSGGAYVTLGRVDIPITSLGHYKKEITARSNSNGISFIIPRNGLPQFALDNVSVKEIASCEYGDIAVYDRGRNTYLEVTENGRSKGKISLGNLNSLVEPKECGGEQNPYDHINCYISNHIKKYPNQGLDEDSSLLAYIKNYLNSNIDSFNQENGIKINSAHIEIYPLDNPNHPFYIFHYDIGSLDKNNIIDGYKNYKERILNSENNAFFVLMDDGVLEPLRTETMLSYTSSGSSSWVMGSDCTYASQLYESSVIPCNKQIDVFLGLLDQFPDPSFGLKYQLQRLGSLGYNVNFYEIKNKSERKSGIIFDNILNSKAQFIYMFLHGGRNGFSGPVACSPVPEVVSSNNPVTFTLQNERELRNWWGGSGVKFFGKSCSDKVLSLIDSTDPEIYWFIPSMWQQDIMKISDCQGRSFLLADYMASLQSGDLESICPQEDLSIYVKFKAIDIDDRAFYGAANCYGEIGKFNNLYSSYTRPAYSFNLASFVEEDAKLLVNYLKGLGPDPNHHGQYPPEILNKNNINASDVESFGEFYHENEELMIKNADDPCLNNEGLSIPCSQDYVKDEKDVHLFPYITNLNIDDGWLKVDFSDKVTKPRITFFDNNSNAKDIFKEKSQTEKSFSYEILPEVDIITNCKRNDYDWCDFTQEEKDNVSKALIEISGSMASAGSNNTKMVGNVLAEQTNLNKSKHPDLDRRVHEEHYWLYDDYFWNYNARWLNGSNSFIARIPYKAHPWVESVGRYGASFSYPVKIENACENIKIDVGSKCVLIDSDKPFESEEGKPRLQNSEYIRWKLREDINLVSVDSLGVLYNGNRHSWSWVRNNWGSEFNQEDWPEEYAVKIKIGNVVSDPNEFPLMGNTESEKKWDFDSDRNNELDAWEKNSSKIAQKEGDFEIWLPCAPKNVACGVPQEDSDGVYGYICGGYYTKKQCENIGGIPKEGMVCLGNYNDYYGEPKENGKIEHFPRPVLSCANDSVKIKVELEEKIETGEFVKTVDAIGPGFFNINNSNDWGFSTSPFFSSGRSFDFGVDNLYEYFEVNGSIYYDYENNDQFSPDISVSCNGASFKNYEKRAKIRVVDRCDKGYYSASGDCCKWNEDYVSDSGCVSKFNDSFASCNTANWSSNANSSSNNQSNNNEVLEIKDNTRFTVNVNAGAKITGYVNLTNNSSDDIVLTKISLGDDGDNGFISNLRENTARIQDNRNRSRLKNYGQETVEGYKIFEIKPSITIPAQTIVSYEVSVRLERRVSTNSFDLDIKNIEGYNSTTNAPVGTKGWIGVRVNVLNRRRSIEALDLFDSILPSYFRFF